MRVERRRLFLLVSFLGLVFIGFSVNTNEARYLTQSLALTTKGVWNIDDYHHLNTDKSFYKGHYYPAAPPGLSIIVSPWVALSNGLYHFVPEGLKGRLKDGMLPQSSSYQRLMKVSAEDYSDPVEQEKDNKEKLFRLMFTAVVVRILYCAPLAGFLAVALFAVLGKAIPEGKKGSVGGLVLLVLVAGNGFYYIPTLFSHLTGTALLVGVLWGWLQYRETGNLLSLGTAGLLLGFAPMVDYPLGVAGFLLGLMMLASLEGRRDWGVLIGSVSIGILAFMAYHQMIFDGPFDLAHRYIVYTHHKVGLYGLTFPHISAFSYLLFSQERGFFLYNPLMPLAIGTLFWTGGGWRVWQRRLAWGLVGLWFSLLCINASFQGDLQGGISWGPRYLIPGAILMAWALVPLWFSPMKKLILIVGLAAFAVHGMARLTPITVWVDETRPIEKVVRYSAEHGLDLPVMRILKRTR